MEIAPYIYKIFTLLSESLIYFIIPIALIYNVVYLSREERRQSIGMAGWGTAHKAKQPFLYFLLWFIYAVFTTVFLILFITMIIDFTS